MKDACYWSLQVLECAEAFAALSLLLVLEATLQVGDLVPDFRLQEGRDSKHLHNILLLIPDHLRPDEYSLTHVVRPDDLDEEVHNGVHNEPVVFLEAEQAPDQQQDRRLKERVVDEEC